MKLPIDKEWFEKRAAAEGDSDATTGRRKTMTLNLTDDEIAELERLVNPSAPTIHWRCFHCDEVFTEMTAARLHFGMDQCSDPACKIKMGAEGSLVKALRRAEADLADAWAAIHNESTEAAKAYNAQQSRHQDQLRAAEELGYERGLADGRADPATVSNVLVDVDNEDDDLILEVAKAIALHGVGREWDDFEPVNAYDLDHGDLKEYARAAIYASPIAKLETSERLTFETSARLLKERDGSRTALKLAIEHIEHMAAFIGTLKVGYSFEGLGEDLPGIKAAASEGSKP